MSENQQKLIKEVVYLTGANDVKIYQQHFDFTNYYVLDLTNVSLSPTIFDDLKNSLNEYHEKYSHNEKLAIIVNSDIITQELNNIFLSHDITNVELLKEFGYSDLKFRPSIIDVEAYQIKSNNKIQKLNITEYGINVQWMNLLLEDLYDKTVKIQSQLE